MTSGALAGGDDVFCVRRQVARRYTPGVLRRFDTVGEYRVRWQRVLW